MSLVAEGVDTLKTPYQDGTTQVAIKEASGGNRLA